MLKFLIRKPTHRSVGLRLPIAFIVTGCFAAAAPTALGDTVSSSNWAGYAVHRAATQFKKVSGSWIQPTASCASGTQTYSAIWVGLGGYNESSDALEQIGSEVDCRASGKVDSTLWYELVPAPSRSIKMKVRPGDALTATVTVRGRTVILSIRNLTTRHTFTKTIRTSTIDVSSAEWIVEAPSDCINANTCQTLPLANFGSTTFGFAAAQSTAGHIGSISDPAWDSSKIRLTASGRRFVSYNGSTPVVGVANPSALDPTGASFNVTYSTVAAQNPPVAPQRAAASRAGYLVHPGR
jgi:Peptidase A4 family